MTGSYKTRLHGLRLPIADTRLNGLCCTKVLPWRRRDGGTSTRGAHECRATQHQFAEPHMTPCKGPRESLRPTRRNDSNLSVFRAEQPRHVDDQAADNDARGEPEPWIAGNVAVD